MDQHPIWGNVIVKEYNNSTTPASVTPISTCEQQKCTISIREGTNIILSTNAKTGYLFQEWNGGGGCQGVSQMCQFIMTGNRETRLLFVPKLTANPTVELTSFSMVSDLNGTKTGNQVFDAGETAAFNVKIKAKDSSIIGRTVKLKAELAPLSPEMSKLFSIYGTPECGVTLPYADNSLAECGVLKIGANEFTPAGSYNVIISALDTNNNILLKETKSFVVQNAKQFADFTIKGNWTTDSLNVPTKKADQIPLLISNLGAFNQTAVEIAIKQKNLKNGVISTISNATTTIGLNGLGTPQGYSLSITYPANEGSYEIWAEINPNSLLKETNYANNKTTVLKVTTANQFLLNVGYSQDTLVWSSPPCPTGYINCGNGYKTCSLKCEANKEVTLTAIPQSGFMFMGWKGDCASAGVSPICKIPMNSTKNIEPIIAPAYPTNGLVAYYSFNKDSCEDMSGNNNHADSYNAYFVTGKLKDGLKLVGKEYCQKKNFNFPTNDFTVAGWIQNWNTATKTSSGTTDYRGILAIHSGANATGYGDKQISLRLAGTTRIDAIMSKLDGQKDTTVLNVSGLEPNKWYHVVFTNQMDSLKLYLNGVLVDSKKYTLIQPAFNVQNGLFDIGSSAYYQGKGSFVKWFGMLDEIFVYNRALTDAEVQQLYAMK